MVVAGCIEVKQMSPTSPTDFRKTTKCPSSEDLLNYRRGESPFNQRATIENHLRDCDFCNAELQLLKSYAAAEDSSNPLAEMPFVLRRLAEDLLKKSVRQFLNSPEFTVPHRLSH